MTRKRVMVAMSGGVDSSVALALLKEQGYECIGVSMQLWDYSKKEEATGATGGNCCSLEDLHDARRVADMLGVPFYVVNVEEEFSREVVEYFARSYLEGATPNPCIKCNEIMKFKVLLDKARALEADFLATGHYARIEERGGRRALLKGVDPGKDQSYFLFTMTPDQLGSVLFPVGGLTKGEVRARARELGLKTSEKEESQEICFVEGPGYGEFLAERFASTSREGEIVDLDGRVLGAHRGLFNYTIGQRKGLGLSGGPYYVVEIDTRENRLVVGRNTDLYSGGLRAGEVNWMDPAFHDQVREGGAEAVVKLRYRHRGAPASVALLPDGGVEVRFNEPQRAVTPGQAAVFYRGDEVTGGGWITEAKER